MFKFHFVDSDVKIITKINEAAILKIKKQFSNPGIISDIENAVRAVVKAYIRNTDVWKDLESAPDPDNSSGLPAHLGLNRGSRITRLNTVLEAWANEVIVKPNAIKRRARTFIFSYMFYAIKSDWSGVLSLDEAIVRNINNRSKAGIVPDVIPWLEWLLTAGDSASVDEYHIQYGPGRGSRSGQALMVPKLNWVLPEFARGTTDNNFVTRALDEIKSKKDQSFRNALSSIMMRVGGFGGRTGSLESVINQALAELGDF